MGAKATTSISRQKSSDEFADYMSSYATSLTSELTVASPWYCRPTIESYSRRWSSIFASNRRQHQLTTSNGNVVTVQYNELLLFIRERCMAAITQLLPIMTSLVTITIPSLIAVYWIVMGGWTYLFLSPALNVIGRYVPYVSSSMFRFTLIYIVANVIMLAASIITPKYGPIAQLTTIIARGILTNGSVRYWWSILKSAPSVPFHPMGALVSVLVWEVVPVDVFVKFMNGTLLHSMDTMMGIVGAMMVISFVTWSPNDTSVCHTLVDEFFPRSDTNLMVAIKRVTSIALNNYYVVSLINIQLAGTLVIYWLSGVIERGSVVTSGVLYSYQTIFNIIVTISIITMIIVYHIRPSSLSLPPSHYQRCSVAITDGGNGGPRFVRLMDVMHRSSRIIH